MIGFKKSARHGVISYVRGVDSATRGNVDGSSSDAFGDVEERVAALRTSTATRSSFTRTDCSGGSALHGTVMSNAYPAAVGVNRAVGWPFGASGATAARRLESSAANAGRAKVSSTTDGVITQRRAKSRPSFSRWLVC